MGGGVGVRILPAATLDVSNFLNIKANATKLSDFFQNLSGNNLMWHVTAHVTWRFHGDHILTGMFFQISISLIKKIKTSSLEAIFKSLDRFIVFLFVFVLADFGRFLEDLDKSRNPRWRTKMAAIQNWLRNYYVMWRHSLMMRTSEETCSYVLSTLQVSLL